jgi:hypothetical protein
MSIPSQHEYEAREAAEFRHQLAKVEAAPLFDRKYAAKEFAEALHSGGRDAHENLVAERIGWLLNGSYGYGSAQAARRVARASGRTNKTAQLSIMIAALEWQCPAKMAVAAWKKLSPVQQSALDNAIRAEIKSHLEEE